jgi:hypothetical protein
MLPDPQCVARSIFRGTREIMSAADANAMLVQYRLVIRSRPSTSRRRWFARARPARRSAAPAPAGGPNDSV